jgi:hypothetical protein
MNVALTRARSSLFILGNAPTLQRSDENWKNIVTNAKSRSQFVDVSPVGPDHELRILRYIRLPHSTSHSPARL